MSGSTGSSVVAVVESTRSAGAYEAAKNGALQQLLDARYLQPSEADVTEGAAQRLERWKSRLWAMVPMAEVEVGVKGEVPVAVEGMARYLSRRIDRGRFFVINAGSHEQNVAAARNGGAVVVEQDAVFDAVNWEKLLPVIGRDKRPMGRQGKGFTVLAGHLILAALGLNWNEFVFQTDAEVADYERYNALDRLLLCLDREPKLCHLKMAKFGRNNETTMAARTMLQNFFRLPLPWIPENVRKFARDVFEATAADKWMLTGEWLSAGPMVLERPLATGYGEETLQAVWSVHAPDCRAKRIRYVANPHARADGENAPRKEDLMMASLSAFLQALVLNGTPPCIWTPADFTRFNREVMSQLGTIPVIGQDNGPVQVHEIKPEGIIPSVGTLIRNRWVDLEKVRRVVAVAT